MNILHKAGVVHKAHRISIDIKIILYVFFIVLTTPSFGQQDIPSLVRIIKPAVVTIFTYDANGDTLSQGSGFFINSRGDLITNYHVLSGASNAEVKTAGDRIYAIRNIIAENFDADIIMVGLENPPEPVQYLNITTNLPAQGERILVFGSPFGLELTVSDGIVSAVRDIPDFGNIIQITAPISPGSSGGPVVNMRGEVFGIATFQHLEGQNLNFAVPSKMILDLRIGKKQPLSEWTAKLVKDWFESAEWIAYIGFVYIWAAEYDSALYYFEKAISKDSLNSETYFWIGYCYSELGKYYRAIESYKQAINLDPNFSTAYNNIGVAYYELGFYQYAIGACKKAIYIDSNSIESYITLGLAYGKLNKPNDAIKAYKEILHIDPDYGLAYYNIGVIYYNIESYVMAVESFRKAINIMPEYADAYFMVGLSYHGLEQFGNAINAYNNAILLDPTYAEAYLNIAIACGDLGSYEEGIKFCQKAIQINHQYAMARFILGGLYSVLGDKTSALEQYNILKDLDATLSEELLNCIYENISPSRNNYQVPSHYGFQSLLVLKDFDDDEHLIIELSDGTHMLLEAKTYCFTYGLLAGLIVDAKVGPLDVKIYHNDKTYEYWVEEEY